MTWQILLGVLGAVTGLVFLGIIGLGEDWYGSTGLGWFEGHPWRVAVATAVMGAGSHLIDGATIAAGEVDHSGASP